MSMPQLDLSTFPSQIFWLIVCFGILCFAITVFLAPNMGKSLALRQEELNALKEKAEKFLAETERLSHENEVNLERARKEAAEKIQKIIAELTQFKDQKILEFETNSQGKLKDIHQSLHVQKEEILKEADTLISQLAQDMFTCLTGHQLAEGNVQQALQAVQTIHNQKESH